MLSVPGVMAEAGTWLYKGSQQTPLPPPLPPDYKPEKINANCSPKERFINPSFPCLYQGLELWLTAATEPGKGVTALGLVTGNGDTAS